MNNPNEWPRDLSRFTEGEAIAYLKDIIACYDRDEVHPDVQAFHDARGEIAPTKSNPLPANGKPKRKVKRKIRTPKPDEVSEIHLFATLASQALG